jgi:exo-beta-1,3-glucanase (GH17 family)
MGRLSVNQHLAGIDFPASSHDDIVLMLRKILDNKIHGISFSPYIDGQGPGIEINEAQIEQRLKIIQPYTHWVRTFSCVDGHQNIPRIAKQNNLKTMVGVSLGEDLEINEVEFNNALEIVGQGVVDILAIGNEVLLRGDLEEQDLLGYIHRAKQAAPDVCVSYVDAYYQFEEHPRLVDAVDVLLINCYPFWENCPAEYSLLYMKEMYRRTVNIAQGKKIIISETGWPSAGSISGVTLPSHNNAMQYFINTYSWAQQENIEIFYFSSFDESWKTGDEGDVGAYWGLWDKDGNFKYT